MASTDCAALQVLRLLSTGISGGLCGVGLYGPLVAVPALLSAADQSRESRLRLWSRLHAETTSLTSLLFPLLTGCLALCALLAHSDPSPTGCNPTKTTLCSVIAENRKSLFTLAAVLILALRPYSFGLLNPRIEALKAEERRLALLLEQRSPGLRAALGQGTWRGASPAGSDVEGEDEGEESDEEDNVVEDVLEEKSGLLGRKKKAPDTDAIIAELSRLQLGAVALSSAAFFLTLLELVCA
ncbi:hypothetical protein JCM10207_005956 [Rhodosporidiobolus poonsookiae]